MRRKYVIVSGAVEPMIQDSIPDTEVILFKSISQLDDYVSVTPIRADVLYVSQEVLMPALGSSIDWILSITNRAFFETDRVVYILDASNDSDKAIEHVKQLKKLDNWSYVRGDLTRVFISNVITGANVSDDIKPRRKVIYRQKRSEYVQENLKRQQKIEDEYSDELEGIEAEEFEQFEHASMQSIEECKTYHVTGIQTVERTSFAWMLGQYLALTGKTVILEKDVEYLTLGDMITKSKAEVTIVTYEELYTDVRTAIRKIKTAPTNLVAVLHNSKGGCNYNFMYNLLQVSLKESISNLIIETELEELTGTSDYVVVMQATVPSMLKTFDRLQYHYLHTLRYVAVDLYDTTGISVTDGDQISKLIGTMTGLNYKESVPVLKFKGTTLGGEFNAIHLFS